MRKKFLFFLMVGLIIQLKLNAQASFGDLENNKVIYPSPTAAGLGKYGSYPVNLYNGLVDIGQDIVTVKSGHLQLNVSLSYHASGNKPSDIPGWVGLGMSLNAGGVITRVVRDQPDVASSGFVGGDNAGLKYLWNNYPNSELLEEYYSGTLDTRSDTYQYNFCGKTGEFFFDWDGHIHFKQQVPFKVEILGGGADFGFLITTDDGTQYRFDQPERTGINATSTTFNISSWYLTKISNLYSDNIILKYTAPLSKFRYKQYGTRKEVTGPDPILVTGPTVSLHTTTDEVIYLNEIDFSTGKLLFGTSKRNDPYFVPDGITSTTAEEQKLDLITLKDNSNNVIKQWKFEYFENNTERLKLKNLIAQGSDQTDVQKYSFSYNFLVLPLPLPGPTAQNPYFSNSVDYWGYYNGWANGDNRIPKIYMPEFNQWIGSANREINSNFAKAEILEKITYPTGGTTSFEFESNDYSAQGASFAADQNPMTYRQDLSESYELHYVKDDGGFDADPASITFTLTEPTRVHLTWSCGSAGPLHSWANPGVTYESDNIMQPGTYNFAGLFNTNELLQPGSDDITKASCYAMVYKLGPTLTYYAKTGPGLRIKSITTSDGITTNTRSFEYKYGGSQNTQVSSGYLSVFPAFYAPLVRIAINLSGYYAASDPINDIGDGAPVGYSRVVERFQDNSYIVHYFKSYDDYPDEINSFTNGYSSPLLAHMTSHDWQRGQETNTVYYDANGVIQKEIINNYDVLPSTETNVQAIEIKPTVGIVGDGGETNNINATITSVYTMHSGFLYNSGKTETVYDKNGQNPITTYVDKAYDNPVHLQPTRVETGGSDGSVLTTVTSFPDDYAPGVPFIDYMQANHLMSFPIEQVVYKQRAGVTNIISGNIITYKSAGAGLADQLLKLETTGPIAQANFKFSSRLTGVLPWSPQPAQYSADARYQPVLTYTQYDNKGNPLETISRSNIRTCYLWGYNQEFPVAKIVGSDYTTVSGKITDQSILANPPSDDALRTQLNNLRTIPGALASTYTYSPLIGVTSETDPNGRTTYYEYDPFSRLSVIRDQDHNVVKKYCYSYTGQLSQCGFYKSDPISGNYYSQNCPSGQTPVAYPVSVPAGMFTSLADQATANQLAQQYAQDQANQHGTCQIVYKNDPINANYYSQNCPAGQTPVAYPVSVAQGTFTSTVDQATANQLAQQYAQNQANQHGSCQIVYKSDPINANYYSQVCPSGQIPAAYPVSLAQGAFTSTVDQATANQLAQQYAQGQANQHGSCLIVYKSDPINADYFSQNCPSGQGPVAYHVNLAQGAFTSTVNQATANQLAAQYAQDQANQHGACTILNVSLSYDNEIGGPLSIQVTNSMSGQTYWFTAYGHDSGELGQLPPGTYNITINGTSYFYAEINCGYYNEGPTPLTFYGVNISPDGCNYISIY